MLDGFVCVMTGLVLGWLLYMCVRLRGTIVPLSIVRAGPRGPVLTWLATILLMILISNLFLIGLRFLLLILEPDRGTLIFEIWFAIISFSLAMFLVTRRARKQDCSIFSCR